MFKDKLLKAGDNGKLKWKAIKTELLLHSEKDKIVEIIEEGVKITEDKK